MNQREQEIIDMIAAETGIDRQELCLAVRFYDIGIDSLSALEVLAALEQKYGIVLDERELRDTDTIGTVVNIVAAKLRQKEERA